MNKNGAAFICLLLAAAFLHGNPNIHPPDAVDLQSLLPATQNLGGWVPDGTAEVVKGEDLYLLINGGAEVYHEYGFRQALAIGFKNREGKYINLEIYQMKSDASAYGIFTFKTGKEGKKVAVGQEALLEDYYLNFWKGDLIITLIGFDTSRTSIQGILHIARLVDRNIARSGRKPRLVSQMHPMIKNAQKVKYILGNLGLFNQYRFDTANIFGVSEGMICTYQSCTQFVFQYKTKGEVEKWLTNGLQILSHNPRFKRYSTGSQTSGFIDDNNHLFVISAVNRFILITMHTDRDQLLHSHQKILTFLHSDLGRRHP